MSTSDARTELFRSSWSLYDTVIEANYMFHREIESAVAGVMGRNILGFSLLDLGCGSARGLATMLRTAPPRLYVGVDMSRPALEQAAAELAGLPEVRLQEEDMLACVERFAREGQSFDWVHSAFALHHLGTADKGRLFHAVARVLAPGGSFILVDVVRNAGQSLEEYLEMYLKTVDEKWLELSLKQRQEVREHVMAYDFPETLTELTSLAQAAGFQEPHLLGKYGDHQVMHFRKSP